MELFKKNNPNGKNEEIINETAPTENDMMLVREQLAQINAKLDSVIAGPRTETDYEAEDRAAVEKDRLPIQQAHNRDKWYVRKATPEDRSPLTKEEQAEIEKFWKPYAFAFKNDPAVQWAFSRTSGRFDPSYIGFGMMRYVLRRWYSHSTYVGICHKSYLERIFPFVKQPHSFVHRSYGHYFNHEYLPISMDEAVSICYDTIQHSQKYKEMIIKPADTTGEGKGITFFTQKTSKEEIRNTFESFESTDFIVQEVIKNHPSFAAPNPGSMNTMRVVTLMWKEKVYHVCSVLRMGIDKRVDNFSQGGIGIPVLEGGVLGNVAMDYYGKRFEKHPNGFSFSGHVLFNADKVVETAMLLHETIPQQKYVSWDLTVDEQGDTVLIEINSPGGTEVPQVFGMNALINKEMAKEILDEYLIKRFFWEHVNEEYNYREFADHISLTKYRGNSAEIVVPKTMKGKPVRMVYKGTFENPRIKKISIPLGIYVEQTSFGACAPNCEVIRI